MQYLLEPKQQFCEILTFCLLYRKQTGVQRGQATPSKPLSLYRAWEWVIWPQFQFFFFPQNQHSLGARSCVAKRYWILHVQSSNSLVKAGRWQAGHWQAAAIGYFHICASDTTSEQAPDQIHIPNPCPPPHPPTTASDLNSPPVSDWTSKTPVSLVISCSGLPYYKIQESKANVDWCTKFFKIQSVQLYP